MDENRLTLAKYCQSVDSEALKDFIVKKMKMSHIYQPLLIRLLIESGGQSTIRQLAKEFSAFDESHVRVYEKRLRDMPIRVLRRHGVVTFEKNLVTLDVPELSLEERRTLIAECEAKITQFIRERGLSTWSNLLELDAVEESIRYRVLRRDRVCVLCGAKPQDAQLQVDHIVPRSKGGSNDMSNLQTLCARCNRGKSNLDDTDLRPINSNFPDQVGRRR